MPEAASLYGPGERFLIDTQVPTLPNPAQDQYLEITTAVPESASLYGLGERTTTTGVRLRRDGVPLALWNRDHQAALPDQNVYGSHPILMDVREGGSPGSP